MIIERPLPDNELERLLSLSEFDLDYNNLQENFKDLTKLAAKVAGAEISLVNLIDTYTQWTVSNHGLLIEQMPREESVCQYTIVESEQFEVSDLSADDRFKNKFYVEGEPKLRFYFGVPLTSDDGYNLGALCVLDKFPRSIDPEKIELLKIIADEIVNRINTIKIIEALKSKAKEASDTKLKVAHDIRGPLSGIIGLAQLVSAQGDRNKLEEVLQFVGLIQKSSSSILELADEILKCEKKGEGNKSLKSNELNLLSFEEKIEKLYVPQTISKRINFSIVTSTATERIPFLKNKLLQITGNLISNAIKFTPQNGTIVVKLDLTNEHDKNILLIEVKDSGVGLSSQAIESILNGNASSTDGTGGEAGFGFGLSLVKHLIAGLKGTLKITSQPNEGAIFSVQLPLA